MCEGREERERERERGDRGREGRREGEEGKDHCSLPNTACKMATNMMTVKLYTAMELGKITK